MKHMLSSLCSFVIFLCGIRISIAVSCRNENNQDVDWYANYKIPKIEDEPPGSLLAEGEAYAYITTIGKWKLSDKGISSANSMMGNTLNEFFENKDDFSYLLYNDEGPDNLTGTSVGHLKGVVVFDGTSGFWLIHSVPKFPPENRYEYPSTGRINGQSILCITFQTNALNEIARQLLYNHPYIYAKGITSEVMEQVDDDAKSIFSDRPLFIKKPPYTRQVTMRSNGNKQFTSFAKDNQFNDDLYSALIAPALEVSLLVETWRRGSGTYSPPSCETDYRVNDVQSVNITVTDKRNRRSIGFKSTTDHSKWAVSVTATDRWICIADINRMESQKRRGGGAMCFQSTLVWRAYDSVINETDSCGIIDNIISITG